MNAQQPSYQQGMHRSLPDDIDGTDLSPLMLIGPRHSHLPDTGATADFANECPS
ncbi:hypothetical protein [Methylorubrum zatmanii]|uniref:Uncharacterized protein n=1 Tax=Methylorubrum zatmanii TaxID=29429 RepID=A0ABW1WSB1_9HYPH|nr:hypothetical protein [Methylorubrum zatmanii]